MTLSSLGLSQEVLIAVKQRDYTYATPIQEKLIPVILAGSDAMAGAKTGTGKTAAYMLPILSLISKQNKSSTHGPVALVLLPTKELAKQVYQNTIEYAKYTDINSVLLYGGANVKTQANKLENNPEVIISTTGRLLEHLSRRNTSLGAIKWLVLDEADTMLDMGFLNEIGQVLEHLPKERQNTLVSATLTGRLKTLSQQILIKPRLIEVDDMGNTADNVEQLILPVVADKKDELLSYLIGSKNYKKVLLFTRKKELVDAISAELNLCGLKSMAIHGDKTSGMRAKAIEQFKANKIRVLVATDIAARGLDISDIDAVINYDIPHVLSDYIHRIGRTARAGKSGIAITLVTPPEEIALRDLERLLGKEIAKEYLDGYAPPKESKQMLSNKVSKKVTKIAGAFGDKKRKPPSKKKRKTTKRDGWGKK